MFLLCVVQDAVVVIIAKIYVSIDFLTEKKQKEKMDGVVPDEGRKRRLPLWMLGVAAADQVRKTEVNGNVNGDIPDEGIADRSCQPKLKVGEEPLEDSSLFGKCEKRRRKRKLIRPDAGCDSSVRGKGSEKEDVNKDNPDQRIGSQSNEPKLKAGKEPLDVDSCLLAECETKRRKRKLSKQNDSKAHETGFEKKRGDRVGRAARESVAQNRQKVKSFRFESREEIEISSPSEDDGELTMEDLMNIAEEYLKADKDMVHMEQQSSDREHEVGSHHTAAVSRNESGVSLNAPQSNRRSPVRKETTSIHNSTKNSLTEENVMGPRRTGDPTQDMLSLFLGPVA
ncbi:hypothetical protein F0562_032338 [Nyssa sinensis]|uniref:Uncharacterized protein n=1 Tax=Nyssa sinensis TaxID=561372 RepID=A0A5J5AMH1_9ASTE|nr:hypothetical protein F0562_032338 [Nyssa sinensis]